MKGLPWEPIPGSGQRKGAEIRSRVNNEIESFCEACGDCFWPRLPPRSSSNFCQFVAHGLTVPEELQEKNLPDIPEEKKEKAEPDAEEELPEKPEEKPAEQEPAPAEEAKE